MNAADDVIFQARAAFAAVIGGDIPPSCDYPKCTRVEGHTDDHKGWDDEENKMGRWPNDS